MTSAPTRRLTLTGAILGSGIALLDGTIAGVALPTIQRNLGGGLGGQQWVSSAYSLAVIVGLAGIRNPPGIATAPSQP